MSRSVMRSESGGAEVSAEAVEGLVDRLSKSVEFGQSTRSQEVLRYLCRRVLQNPEERISEHQIGVAIFGWHPDRDAGDDTSVRVQISQLRRRLEHYFSSEGAEEPIAIRLPRGSYSPIFEVHNSAPANLLPSPVIAPPAAPPVWRTRWILPLLIATNLATAILAIAVFFWARNGVAPASVSPNLDQFWAPFRTRPAQVVLSDGNLVVLGEMLGRDITLHEYRNHFNPGEVVHSSISDPAVRSVADRVLPTHLTGTQDADVFGMVSSLLTRYRVPVSSISGPDFQIFQPDNVILLGHPRVNPWIHLFDDRLSFQYRFDWKERKGQIVNVKPAHGEQEVYTAEFGNHGYCVVACLPKPMDGGVALLIYGSDMSSLKAGGRFVTDERWVARLYSRLGVSTRNAPRYFEVLLRTELLDSMAHGFDIVTWRLPSQ